MRGALSGQGLCQYFSRRIPTKAAVCSESTSETGDLMGLEVARVTLSLGVRSREAGGFYFADFKSTRPGRDNNWNVQPVNI